MKFTCKEREILKAQVINEGKPEAMADKIVDGKISKYYKFDRGVFRHFLFLPRDISISAIIITMITCSD